MSRPGTDGNGDSAELRGQRVVADRRQGDRRGRPRVFTARLWPRSRRLSSHPRPTSDWSESGKSVTLPLTLTVDAAAFTTAFGSCSCRRRTPPDSPCDRRHRGNASNSRHALVPAGRRRGSSPFAANKPSTRSEEIWTASTTRHSQLNSPATEPDLGYLQSCRTP